MLVLELSVTRVLRGRLAISAFRRRGASSFPRVWFHQLQSRRGQTREIFMLNILNAYNYSSMSLKPFRFLDLPPEIRQKTYSLICMSHLQYISLNQADAHSSFPFNLLLTNSQIYHEIRPVYFTVNAFCVTVRRQNLAWEYFIKPSFQDNRRQIHSLMIHLVRWGPKDFFRETLVPLVEDCILNGRLKCLEFRVSEKWFNSQESRGRTGHYFMKGDTLNDIRKLLTDPYLQSAILKAGDMRETECGSYGYDTNLPLRNVTERLFEVDLEEAGDS